MEHLHVTFEKTVNALHCICIFFKKGRWGVGEVFAVAMAYHKVCEHECKTLGNKHKLYLTKKIFKSKTILEEEEKRRRKKS